MRLAAVACLLGLAGSRVPAQDFSHARWIVVDDALAGLMKLDPSDTQKYFNTPFTTIQGHAGMKIPAGWSSVPQLHYSSFEPCTAARDRKCTSLTDDTTAGAVSSASIPLVMYDDEKWRKTPVAEQRDPCGYMQQFTRLAHAKGFATIMAPDQNIAGPLVAGPYQGGESQNWQAYLRLALAACAARTGTERFHVMSQPFESHWGPTPEGTLVGGEADFVNYAVQATLQAKAVNPKLIVTAGLSANPRYKPTAQIMYQETVDVQGIVVDGLWLNLWATPVGVDYLKLLSGRPAQSRSSVLFAHSAHSLDTGMPRAGTSSKLNLAHPGASLTSWTAQTLPAGAVIPAGAWEFQFWTDGASGSAQLALEFGYCDAGRCTRQTPIIASGSSWAPTIPAGSVAAADARGAFTTTTPTTLPAGGPWRLYWSLKVVNPAPFNLLYDSPRTPTNLATPILLSR